ncbi:MAG: TasA family protein [Candidatus Veblenbacteria bacterium]|nr:TasA family protein [Candidatus Veblenbacteria bacterium]
MKKILLSLAAIGAVAAVVVAGTGAFFSDTETSTGNVFTAGAIDLTVDSEQHYNGNVCTLGDWDEGSGTPDTYAWQGSAPYPVQGTPCDGTWLATDLGAHTFFNFDDIKPGDFGENTISLHVDSNDAYACVDVNITKNDDVTCTNPEEAAEGVGICENSNPSADFDGELAQNLYFTAWSDWGATPGFQGNDSGEGDNIWQQGEPLLFSNDFGPASDVLGGVSYTLADSSTVPLTGGSTSYIGLAWCAGSMTVDTNTNNISCDGNGMGNDTQTDSMVADIAFRVEQARNNDDFTCQGSTS